MTPARTDRGLRGRPQGDSNRCSLRGVAGRSRLRGPMQPFFKKTGRSAVTCGVLSLLVASIGAMAAGGCGHDPVPAANDDRTDDVVGSPDAASTDPSDEPGQDDDANGSPAASKDASSPTGADDAGPAPAADAGARPLALVYRGDDEAGCEGCSEAVQHLLETSKFAFEVKFVGPKEKLHADDATLATAVLYAQPAGNASVSKGWKYVKDTAPAIRKFVQNGGHYLGFCMGGYFAGKDPGFELLPGDTDQWIASKKASVKDEDDAIVEVQWRKAKRFLYFQDGPYFLVDENAAGVTVLAKYASNDKIAAVVAPYGKGKVGVVGPHPEADDSWYKLAGLKDPDGLDADLGHDLVETLMQ